MLPMHLRVGRWCYAAAHQQRIGARARMWSIDESRTGSAARSAQGRPRLRISARMKSMRRSLALRCPRFRRRHRFRARQGSTSILPKIELTDQALLREAIHRERRAELAMEGERFYDLVRWDKAMTVLGPQGYQARNRYYPIPQSAIDKSNGKLKQNPDY